MIPHPSGLCRWYNAHQHRLCVEILLADLVRACTEEVAE